MHECLLTIQLIHQLHPPWHAPCGIPWFPADGGQPRCTQQKRARPHSDTRHGWKRQQPRRRPRGPAPPAQRRGRRAGGSPGAESRHCPNLSSAVQGPARPGQPSRRRRNDSSEQERRRPCAVSPPAGGARTGTGRREAKNDDGNAPAGPARLGGGSAPAARPGGPERTGGCAPGSDRARGAGGQTKGGRWSVVEGTGAGALGAAGMGSTGGWGGAGNGKGGHRGRLGFTLIRVAPM